VYDVHVTFDVAVSLTPAPDASVGDLRPSAFTAGCQPTLQGHIGQCAWFEADGVNVSSVAMVGGDARSVLLAVGTPTPPTQVDKNSH
jgi:hypothetical protein